MLVSGSVCFFPVWWDVGYIFGHSNHRLLAVFESQDHDFLPLGGLIQIQDFLSQKHLKANMSKISAQKFDTWNPEIWWCSTQMMICPVQWLTWKIPVKVVKLQQDLSWGFGTSSAITRHPTSSKIWPSAACVWVWDVAAVRRCIMNAWYGYYPPRN